MHLDLAVAIDIFTIVNYVSGVSKRKIWVVGLGRFGMPIEFKKLEIAYHLGDKYRVLKRGTQG